MDKLINMLNKGIRLDYCFPVELSVEIEEEKGNLIIYIQLNFL